MVKGGESHATLNHGGGCKFRQNAIRRPIIIATKTTTLRIRGGGVYSGDLKGDRITNRGVAVRALHKNGLGCRHTIEVVTRRRSMLSELTFVVTKACDPVRSVFTEVGVLA